MLGSSLGRRGPGASACTLAAVIQGLCSMNQKLLKHTFDLRFLMMSLQLLGCVCLSCAGDDLSITPFHRFQLLILQCILAQLATVFDAKLRMICDSFADTAPEAASLWLLQQHLLDL